MRLKTSISCVAFLARLREPHSRNRAPSDVQRGVAFSLTLTAEDAYVNVVTGYTGTVHFSTNAPSATLPADYTFTVADAGVHTFTNAFTLVLPKRDQSQFLDVYVTDTQKSNLTGDDSLYVA